MKRKIEKGTLKKVLSYLAPYRALIALTAFLALAASVLTLYVPILIGRAIDLIAGAGRVDFSGIAALLTRVAAVAAAVALIQWIQNTVNNRIAFQTARDLRDRAFRRIQILPLSYLDAHPTGELVSRVIADVDQFSDGLLMGFTQLFTGVVTIAGTLVFMLSLQPLIALVVVLLTPLSFAVAKFIASRT